MRQVKMQRKSLIEKKGKILTLDLDTKKEIAKIGMTASLGVVTATSFYMKNKFMKNLHIGSGVALIGFSFWHHMLYQPEKKEKQKKEVFELEAKTLTSETISIDNVYTHVKIKGKLTKEDIVAFEKRLEALLDSYKVEKINTLVDIKDLKNVEFLAIWNDFIFLLKHYEIIGKVAIVGNRALQDLSVKITNKLTPASMQYFDSCEEAKKWIL
jgi:hypothetical protein